MPKICTGFVDPDGGVRPCIFAEDGQGGPAQSKGGSCLFCDAGKLELALGSRIGKGNLVRRLKAWRRKGTPVYEAAFTFGTLCALSDSKRQVLRWGAGEPARFERKTSWLHRKKLRLKRFLWGRPIPVASNESLQYLRNEVASSSTYWQNLLRSFSVCRKMESTSSARKAKKRNCGHWKKTSGTAAARNWRRKWWRVRRLIKEQLLAWAAKGPPWNCSAEFQWAMEEEILEPGLHVSLQSTSIENHPICFVAEDGELLYFERNGPYGNKLTTAMRSINNALGKEVVKTHETETSNHMQERGYALHPHMVTGCIYSPLYVTNMLQAFGFKLQLWRDSQTWPAGAKSLLQIRGKDAWYTQYWAALTRRDDKVYLLDCQKDAPVHIPKWQQSVVMYITYAVVPLQ